MDYRSIAYMISHVFLMLFMYLFIVHRFSKRKTAGICAAAFLALCVMDTLKLVVFPQSSPAYFVVTVFQIIITQFTGLFIAKHRDSKALFVGLSASSYVIAGTVAAVGLYIWTGNLLVSMLGSIAVHAVILVVLYSRIREIWLSIQKGKSGESWWELCLIPVFFYCGFSSLAFFPLSLEDYPGNIVGVSVFIITMFISYLVVFRYVASESQRTNIYWKNVLFEAHIRGLENQHSLVEQSEKNLKILRHDIRHYSSVIESLLEQGEYDEIKKVVAHINSVTDVNTVTKYCENLVVNTVLSNMMERAQEMAAEIHLDIIVPNKIPFNSYELAMVIANLFENSLDCIKDFGQKKKSVDVIIRYEENHLLVHMANEYEKEIIFDSATGLPKSLKGRNHGLGMQSVQAFSDKIGGNTGCYCENGIFHIMLFAKF